MNFSADAARVLADEARGSEGGRSSENSARAARFCADGVYRASEIEAGERAITCDGEHGSGYFLSKQSMAESGAFGDSEAMEASEARGGWMHGFEVGDMVWGKVKSHPWWPGHIFNEAFASSSVRRTKREGHVLVAFFGDSSYGWFDPAELIPFDVHYAEKSRQTISRNFTKAVEEAVDEACRRSALGLSCCCRHPSNFRPTTVPGYFVVDVAGYEPGGVYSSKQIGKARDDFAAVEVLSFVNRLAVSPRDAEQGTFDLIRKTSMLLALRKAMFEEFDVTYAEAFGVQPVLPPRATQGGSDQHEKVPFRAALSGPLVIAEALGERKASKAVVRAKDTSAKKNKYLFKRREEATHTVPSLKSPPRSAAAGQLPLPNVRHFPQAEAPNVHYIPHAQADDGSYTAEVGNYVLQKRVPEKPQTKQELGRAPVSEFRGLSPENLDRAAEPGGRSHPPVEDVGVKPEQPAGEELGATAKVGNKSSHHEHKPVVDTKQAMGLKTPGAFADADVKLSFPGADQGMEVGFTGIAAYAGALPMDVEAHHQRTNQTKTVNDVVKKEKARKHSPEIVVGEKKKKRKRKEGGPEISTDQPTPKHKKSVESLRLSAGKSIGIGMPYSDNSLAESDTKTDGAQNSFTPPDVSIIQQLPKLDSATHNLDLPGVLGDLSALALDPFYGMERNVSTVVRHVLLRFRSLVYEKALPFPQAGEHETSEPHVVKFRAGRPPQEAGRESAGIAKEGEAREPTKPPKMKPILKPEDPTKMGRKRLPSDRQEEKLAKKLKKLDRLKALTSEKKAGLVNKTSDVQPRGEQKDTTVTPAVAPAKFPKSDSIKKQETPTPPKVATPTYLVMKFPQRTTLPSISSLKARFARFGPLDLSGTRVFWKSYTCRVLFKHKSDAQSAYNYVQGNDIFGQMRVSYFLREFESGPDAADPLKRPSEDTPQFRPAGGGDLAADVKPKQQSTYSGQLKSILKKPSGDEAAPVGGGGTAKEVPRVKFMLGTDDGRGEPPVVVSSSNNNGSSNTGGILPTPPLLDINRQVPKSVTFLQPLQPPLQPPPRPQDTIHPVPLQPPMVPRVALPDIMPGPRGALPFGKAVTRRPPFGKVEARERSGVDISHQMLSLLTRCNDIVSNVKSALGYVPYHPL